MRRFEPQQERILLVLTETWQRAADVGVGGLFLLDREGYVERRQAACPDCGRTGCETHPMAPTWLLRLSGKGLDAKRHVQRRRDKGARIEFQSESAAREWVHEHLLPGGSLVLSRGADPNDWRWYVSAGLEPPVGHTFVARWHHPMKGPEDMSEAARRDFAEKFAETRYGRWLIRRALLALHDRLDKVEGSDRESEAIRDLVLLADYFDDGAAAIEGVDGPAPWASPADETDTEDDWKDV